MCVLSRGSLARIQYAKIRIGESSPLPPQPPQRDLQVRSKLCEVLLSAAPGKSRRRPGVLLVEENSSLSRIDLDQEQEGTLKAKLAS